MKYKKVEVRDPKFENIFQFLMDKSQVFREAFLNFVEYDFVLNTFYFPNYGVCKSVKGKAAAILIFVPTLALKQYVFIVFKGCQRKTIGLRLFS
jgi:hypothetical protein